MTPEEIAVRLESHDHEIGSLKHRVKAVEDSNVALNRLAKALEVMAVEQEYIKKGVDKLTTKVEAIEAEPGKRWKFVIEKALYFVVAALMGWALAKFGL